MRTISIIILSCLCLARGALAAEGDSAAARLDLLRLLMSELGIRGRQIDVVLADKPLDKWLPTLLFSHAAANRHSVDKLQTVGEHMARGRVVLLDGTMASPVYQQALTVERSLTPTLQPFQLEAWQQAFPDSAQPRLAEAQGRIDVAAGDWRVAYLRPAPTEGHKPDTGALLDIERYLRANKAVMAQDPTWHNLMVELAIYRGAPEPELKALVSDGLAAYPEHIQLAVDASAHYFPKWNGDPSGLGAYAAWVLSLPEMSKRIDIYPRVFAHALYRQYQLTLFKLVQKDWSLLRQGIRHLLATYPAKSNFNTAALLACLAGDRALTGQILLEPSFQLETDLWPNADAPGVCSQWVARPANPNPSRG